ALQRAQDRAVAAEHHAELHVVLDGRVQLQAGRRGEPVLLRLLLVEPQRHARPGGLARELLERRRGVLGVSVGEDRDLPHGSTSRASASSSCTLPAPPPAAASTSQMNVSRLPLGPGRPEEWYPRTAAPSESAASPTDTSAARRWAASRTTPPFPTRPRPTSNCGLTSASTSWEGPRQPSTAPRTVPREMNDT